MTKIAVTTCFHPKLDQFLNAFRRQWPADFDLFIEPVDFKITPEYVSRETMIDMTRDYDAVFTVDADEFFTVRDIDALVEAVIESKHDAVFCKVLDYADTEKIYRVREHKPVVIVNPKEITFYDGRCLRGFTKPLYSDTINLHHFGYTFPPDIMQWKSSNYWDNGNPDGIQEVMSSPTKSHPMPEEIRKYAQAS